jgi:hypothetical protein
MAVAVVMAVGESNSSSGSELCEEFEDNIALLGSCRLVSTDVIGHVFELHRLV